MELIIKYGTNNNNIDVTELALNKLANSDIICIPSDDSVRSFYFGDPAEGQLKTIFIVNKITNDTIEYNYTICIFIDTINNIVYPNNIPLDIKQKYFNKNLMTIKYGSIDNNIDITQIALDKLLTNQIIRIPPDDHVRTKYFTDPVLDIVKSIFIYEGKTNRLNEYDSTKTIFIDIITGYIYVEEVPIFIQELYIDANSRIQGIHDNLKLDFGSFEEEFPEQMMVARYLTGNEKVLEIGGNIGRNSLVIGYILKLKCNNNFVSLESDLDSANQLIHNKNINNMSFHVEPSALSKRGMIQKGWDTIVSNELLPGFKKVNTITLDQLYSKYNIIFDTLVLDCEGAFYYILMDMPEILNNVNLIIMENDYYELPKKEYVDNILRNNGFYVDYTESGGWGPCYNNFYEVWKK